MSPGDKVVCSRLRGDGVATWHESLVGTMALHHDGTTVVVDDSWYVWPIGQFAAVWLEGDEDDDD